MMTWFFLLNSTVGLGGAVFLAIKLAALSSELAKVKIELVFERQAHAIVADGNKTLHLALERARAADAIPKPEPLDDTHNVDEAVDNLRRSLRSLGGLPAEPAAAENDNHLPGSGTVSPAPAGSDKSPSNKT